MVNQYHESNQIHPSAKLGENVILGKFNVIGENVILDGFKNSTGQIKIGDCNIINNNTKILAGAPGINIGDWNVFHNDILMMAEMRIEIGHNCWFGQNTILDGSGGLEISNGVRVGMYSQIWTHVASGELIEGCTLFGKRKTSILNDVWLVGSCIVSPGVTLGERSTYLIGSNVTKSTEANKVYAGSPTKLMEKFNFYTPSSLHEKFKLMVEWVKEYCRDNSEYTYEIKDDTILISDDVSKEQIVVIMNDEFSSYKNKTIFSLSSKTYIKTLSNTERSFYKFLYGNKARFLPINQI